MSFILAIDQGTSTTTTMIVNQKGQAIASASVDFPQYYPAPGYVEHLGQDIKKSLITSIKLVLDKSNIKTSQIAGLAITNQRETSCFFDKNNNSNYPFIVWQCRRSSDICQRLREQNIEEKLHNITGLKLDPYFSASKISWMIKKYPEIKSKLSSGELLFGTIESYLAHWLSGNKLHITDITNASRTMLLNIKTGDYSPECLDIFGVPKQCLPQITKNIGIFGHTLGLDFLPDGIPICAMAGDQQAALFGQACFSAGEAKATFGTGCFILLNTGSELKLSPHGLISSVAFQLDNQINYCLEGSAFIAGALSQFLIEAMGIIKNPEDIESLAQSVHSSDGLVFVPALCGLGAPHWRPDARGVLTGLTRGTRPGHIARAVLEGIALQNTDIISAMAADSLKPKLLKIDGGAANNNLLIQIQADLLDIICLRTQNSQKTALGVAYMAGMALKIFPDLDYLRQLETQPQIFKPNPDRTWAIQAINNYQQALLKA